MSIHNNSIRNIKNVGSNVTSNNLNVPILQNEYQYNTNTINSSNINMEKTSVELSLNVVGLGHQVFENMSKHDFLSYYDQMSQQSAINKKLALKVLLKYKMEQDNGQFNSFANGVQNNQYHQNHQNNIDYSGIPPQTLNPSYNNVSNYNENFTIRQELPENKNKNYNNPFQNNNASNLYNQQPILNNNIQSGLPVQQVTSHNYQQIQHNQQIQDIQKVYQNQQTQQAQQTQYTQVNNQQYQPNKRTQQSQPVQQYQNVQQHDQNQQYQYVQQHQQVQQQSRRGQQIEPVQVEPIQQVQQNYRPVQNIDVSIGPISQNKSIIQRNPDIPRDFDLSSIIDNYANAKNSGMGRNIDVSFSSGPTQNYHNIIQNNNITHNNMTQGTNFRQPNGNFRPNQNAGGGFGIKKNIDISFK